MPKQPLTWARALGECPWEPGHFVGRAGQKHPSHYQPGLMPAAHSPRRREGLASLTRPPGTEDPQPLPSDSPPLAARGELVQAPPTPTPAFPRPHVTGWLGPTYSCQRGGGHSQTDWPTPC